MRVKGAGSVGATTVMHMYMHMHMHMHMHMGLEAPAVRLVATGLSTPVLAADGVWFRAETARAVVREDDRRSAFAQRRTAASRSLKLASVRRPLVCVHGGAHGHGDTDMRLVSRGRALGGRPTLWRPNDMLRD